MADKKDRTQRPRKPGAGPSIAESQSRRTATATRPSGTGTAGGGRQPGKDHRPKQSWWTLVKENFGWGLIIGLPIIIVIIALMYRATDGFSFKATPTVAPVPTVAPSPTPGAYVAPSAPVANAQKNKILYLSAPDATKPQQLYVADPDGSNAVKLTDSPEVKSNPVWSPDGKQIAFTAGGVGVQLINWDGSGLHTLAYNGFSAVWSPDGKQLAFLRSESAKDGKGPDNAGTVRILYITKVDAKPGDEISLAYDALAPVWAPDGSEIVFFSLRNLVLFTAEPKLGGVVKQIAVPNNVGAWFPTFSADGKSLIFYGTPNANYLANSLDQNATFLTPTVAPTATATPATTTAAATGTPVPSPTVTPVPTALPNSITNLYSMNRDGSNLKTLAQVEDASTFKAGYSLFAAYVNNAAEGVGLLTNRPFYRVAPALSADGKKSAVILVTGDTAGIQVVNVDGGAQPVKIIGGQNNLEAGMRLSPTFSADGSKLFYLFQPTAKDKPLEMRAYDFGSNTEATVGKDGNYSFPTCCGFKK